MPNGGSDCCGECGFFVPDDDHGGWCSIRNLYTINPFWTYCANQTYRNSEKIEIPLGPVWINDSRPGKGYSRVVWQPAPSEASQIGLRLVSRDGALAELQSPNDRFGWPFDARFTQPISESHDDRGLAGLVELLCDDRVDDVSEARSTIEKLAPYATLRQLQEAIAIAANARPVAPQLVEDVDAVIAHLENLAKHTKGHIAAMEARREHDS